MKVVVDNMSAVVGPWICKQTGLIWHPEAMTTVGVLDTATGEIVAGLLYERFTGASVTMHQAVAYPGAVTKDFLWYVFYYPFCQLGVERLTGYVESSNTPAIELNLKLGFEIEARLERACPGGDLLIMRMFKENCRFLTRGKRNGRQRRSTLDP